MPQRINRRDFLTLAGLGGGATFLGFKPGRGAAAPANRLGTRSALAASRAPLTASAPAVAERILVVIEMAGGNDGFSMAPPPDAGKLAGLRPTAFPGEQALLDAGNGVLLHPALTRLSQRRPVVVDGLGSSQPDLSHFEMLRRWWVGDPTGTATLTTGFLGRLCDMLDTGAPATGVSIGNSASAALVSGRAGTLGLPEPGWLWWADGEDDDWATTYVDALAAMAAPDGADGELLALARRNLGSALGTGRMIAGIEGETAELESDGLERGLAIATELIDAEVGVRVIQVVFAGDFDTHEYHRERHDALMGELDVAVDSFLGQLDRRGLADRVLVATTSEFGRRPEENGSAGLDHGTASTAMLFGPVNPGRVGEPVSLSDLDDDGNVVATVDFDRYYATIAEGWFEIPAPDVLPSAAAPLDGVF